MYLHEDKSLFQRAVNLASEKFGYTQEIIEKDYYVTELLRLLSTSGNGLIFKGGTSLSKCYHLIKRFSEDIDLAGDSTFSQGNRKKVKTVLLKAFETLGLSLQNYENIHSRRDFNRYEAAYESLFTPVNSALKSALFVETYFAVESFPSQEMPVTSFVGQLFEAEAPGLVNNYSLQPFSMQVQSLERTFVDKLFAICDYYLQGATERHSRHLYDIFKLMSVIKLDDQLQSLVISVRESRLPLAVTLSAKNGVSLQKTLDNIVTNAVYKPDYEAVTSLLLAEDVSYDETIKSLIAILDSGILKVCE